MEKQNGIDESGPYWYCKPGVVEHWFYGVFEGGGAKGVAYSGALLAMAEKKCWFCAVAGASAGAITAALVAAGLSPQDMERATTLALQHIRTGVWTGLRRLQKTTGYFPSEKLHGWLDELLRAQVAQKTNIRPEAAVTFRELYNATGIELNVVAADLSLKRQMIFSHLETPKCAVADAVAASCSIPFAFASRLLHVAEGDSGAQVFHHTIVDGGVWSNFPMHIFEDKAFREYYGRVPVEIEPRKVLGFLLHEGDDQAPPRGEAVKFVEAVPAGALRARAWHANSEVVGDRPVSLASRVGAWLLYPFYVLGRLVDWISGVDRGRWPAPRSKLANLVVHSVDGLLGGIYSLLFGVLACAVVAIGAWEVAGSLAAEQIRVIPVTDWTDPMAYAILPGRVLLAAIGIAVSVLLVFATIVGVVGNRILLRASRRILFGLVRTYVAGSGAPEWVDAKRNVIALPIPPTLNTLSFDMEDGQREPLIEEARQATRAKLNEVLSVERRAVYL